MCIPNNCFIPGPTGPTGHIGLREKDTDNIYIGTSSWYETETAKQNIMEGMLTITDTKKRI